MLQTMHASAADTVDMCKLISVSFVSTDVKWILHTKKIGLWAFFKIQVDFFKYDFFQGFLDS